MLSAADRSRLVDEAAHLGVELSSGQVGKLASYVERLLEWNRKINLTSVTEPAVIVDKHLLDSLALVPHLRDAGTLVDIGTGPGLPAVVLAIALPTLAVTAVESIQKKAMFVRTVSRELGLRLTVEPIRLDQLSADKTFDVAVSRATFDPPEWVERGARLVAPNGRLFAMLSAQQAHPPGPAGFTAEPMIQHELGGTLRRIAIYARV